MDTGKLISTALRSMRRIVAVCAVVAFRVWRRAMKKGGCCGSGCTGNCAQCGRNCDCKKEK